MSDVDLGYERSAAYERFHRQYQVHSHCGSCFYCGGEDTSEDHVPPLATLHKLRGYAPKHQMLLVRCCASCNSALGDMPLMTPQERREYIQNVFLPQRVTNLQREIEELEGQLASRRTELARLRQGTPGIGAAFAPVPPGAVPFESIEPLSWFRRSPDGVKLYQKVDDLYCIAGGIRLRMGATEWVYPAAQ